MRGYIRFVVRYRMAVLAFMFGVTLLAAYAMSKGVIASSIGDFLDEHPDYDRYLDRTREFGNDEVIVIGFEDPNLLSPASLNRLEKIVEKIEWLDGVRRVRSLLDVPKIEVAEDQIFLGTYADRARSNPEKAEALLDDLVSEPLAGNLLISRDGRHSLIVIELTTDKGRRTEGYPDLVENVLAAFEQAGIGPESVHRAGSITILAELMYQSYFNISRLLPFVCTLLLGTTFVLFRRFWPVAITGLVSFMGIVWTMGFAVWLFQEINLLLAMAPLFIMIISCSDVVHLCSSYLLELGRGEPKDRAIERSCSEVGIACFYTSLTTFTGFIALAFVPTPISRQSGVVIGLGVGIALLIALTLTPILFSFMREPKPWRTGATSQIQDLVDALLARMSRLSKTRPWSIVTIFTILTVAAAIGITRFEFECDFVERFDEKNVLQRDKRYFEKHFAGTNYLEIYLQAPGENGLLDAKRFSRITAFQKAIQDLPPVDRVLSAVDYLKLMHARFLPEQEDAAGLPASREALAQYLLLLEGESGIDQTIDYDRRVMRLSVRLNQGGFVATHTVGETVRKLGQEILGEDLDLQIAGQSYLLGQWFAEVMAGQKRGLLFAILVIMIMMMVALRSPVAGFWSMVPNTIPLLLLMGYLGWFWEKVDTDAIIAAMVAIGIGVDDTIHFLMRYRRELRASRDVAAAIDGAFHYSGRAIVITSVILVLGFAPFAVSDYFTTHMMGTLLPGCLAAALAADLFLLPAMIRLGLFRFGTRTRPVTRCLAPAATAAKLPARIPPG